MRVKSISGLKLKLILKICVGTYKMGGSQIININKKYKNIEKLIIKHINIFFIMF